MREKIASENLKSSEKHLEEKMKDMPFISLSKASEFCDYSQEYLSLRARHGKLKAIKIGRNWVTTKEWVEEYIEKVKERQESINDSKIQKETPEKVLFSQAKRVQKFVPPPEDLKKVIEPRFPNIKLPQFDQAFTQLTSIIQTLKAGFSSQLSFSFVFLLIFGLLITGGVFGKTSLQNIYEDVSCYIDPIRDFVANTITQTPVAISNGVDPIRNSVYLGFKDIKFVISDETEIINKTGEKTLDNTIQGLSDIAQFYTQALKNISEETRFPYTYIYTINTIQTAFKDITNSLGNFNLTFYPLADTFNKTKKEVFYTFFYGTQIFKEYTQWLSLRSLTLEQKLGSLEAGLVFQRSSLLRNLEKDLKKDLNDIKETTVYVKDSITATSDSLKETVAQGLGQTQRLVNEVSRSLSDPFVKTYKSLTFEKETPLLEEEEREIEEPKKTEEIKETEKIEETEEKEKEPSPQIVKEIQTITQIQPIKEIIKEVIKEKETTIVKIDEQMVDNLKAQIADLQGQMKDKLYAPGGTVTQAIYITEPVSSPKIYQQNGDIVLQTIGSGNVLLSAATGLQLSGQQITLNSTSQLSPLVYIADKTRIGGTLTVDGEIDILEGGTSSTYYTILKGGDQSATITYTLPTAAGSAGQALITDASGVLSWSEVSSFPTGTTGQTLRHDGTDWVVSSFLYNNGTAIGIGTTSPSVSLHINATDGLVLPSGTTVQRPGTPTTGTIRYNSSTQQFEGYGDANWGSLGGIIDVDQDTYISAETSPGDNNNQLRFFTAGSERMRVDSGGHILPGADSTYNLGAPGNEWANLYVDTLTAGATGIGGDLDLDGNKLIFDADGDTSMQADTDDQIDIELSGADDFQFTANTFSILSGSNITMADDTWLGLGASAARIEFDNQATDEINILGANVGIGTATPGSKLEISDGTDSLQISSSGDLLFVDTDGGASITGPAGGNLTITGSSASGGDLLLISTSNATKGDIQFHSASYYVNSSGQLTLAADETVNGIDIDTGAISDVVDLALVLGAANDLSIDAAATDNTGTTGVINLDVDTTSSQAGMDIDIETITDSEVDTVSGLKITATQSSTDNDVLYGLQITNLAGTPDSGNEYALYQAGTSWDYGAYFEDDVYLATDLTIAGGNINLNNATDIDIDDATANALTISEGSNNYLNITTTDSSEVMQFGNATTNPSYSFLGTGVVTIAGSAEGTNALTLTAGDITITNGDLTLSGGEIAATADDTTGTNFSFTTAATTGIGFGLTADTVTTGTGLSISVDGLSSGKGLDLASTSTALTSGNLLSLDWSPGSATTATGDLLKLNIGSNATLTGNLLAIYNNSSNVFKVGTAQIESAVPHSFTAAGDVSVAYDIVMTNPTAAYLSFEGPGYLRTYHPSGNYDLTLSAANSGYVIVNDRLVVDQDDTDDTALDIDVANVSGDVINLDWNAATTLTGALTGLDLDFTNVTPDGTNAVYGLHINDLAATTASTEYGLYVEGANWDASAIFAGSVGIGATSPQAKLTVAGNMAVGSSYATATAPADGLVVQGNVGIGTYGSAIDHNLEIHSGASYSEINAGEAQFTTSSSREIKENLKIVDGTGILEKIMQVPVYTFDFIEGPKDRMSIISEDFYNIFERGSPKTLRGQEVQMALWLAVQEQQKQISSLMALTPDGLLTTASLADGASINEQQTADSEQGPLLDSFVKKVKQALSFFGMTIENGIASIRELIVDKLTVRKARMEKIEMVDQATGEVWCTWIENGNWVKEKGECPTQTQTQEPTLALGSSLAIEPNLEVQVQPEEKENPGPPNTILDKHPEAETTQTTAAFEFHASKEGCQFTCQIDTEMWQTCTSPVTYTDLKPGYIHTFKVRAIDQQNQEDPAPAEFEWQITSLSEPETEPESIFEETEAGPLELPTTGTTTPGI